MSRVLVLEDNVNQLIAYKGYLTLYGYKVDGVLNGEKGVKALNKHVYDAFIVDCAMPKMCGPLFIKHLQEMGWEQPVLMHTNGGFPPEVQDVLNKEMQYPEVHYAAKTVDYSYLLNWLNSNGVR